MNVEKKLYLGIDIGGTDIKFGIVNEEGHILKKSKIKTALKKSELINSLIDIYENSSKEYKILGVGISAPGIIDSENGVFVTAGAIHELYGENIYELLKNKIACKVSIENDVKCVALAEKWCGNGKDLSNFICLTVGTGVGGAVILNNQLYRGRNFMAGEFGFMLNQNIKNNDTRLATFAMNAGVQTGLVDKYRNKMVISNNIEGKDIFEFAENGDETAQKLIEDFYLSLSTGIYNLIFAFDPEKILIGGAISKRKDFIVKLQNGINSLIQNHQQLKSTPIELPEIKPCRFNNDSGIIGAVYNLISVKN